MRYLIFTFIMSFILFSPTEAQQIEEGPVVMSLGTKNAFSVTVDDANKSLIESSFKDYFKEFGKVKRNRKAKEYYIEDAKIPAISADKRFQVYGKIDENSAQSTLHVWLHDGSDFVNSKDYDLSGFNVLLGDYYVDSKRRVIERELKSEQSVAKQLEKDHKNLIKDNEKMHKNIEKYQQEIADLEQKIEDTKAAIETNLDDQNSKLADIEDQKDVLEGVKDKIKNVGKNN